MKMKPLLLSLVVIALVALGLSQCTLHRTSIYDAKMRDLRQQVQVGENIYAAAKKIEGRYHHTSGPLDPTKLGKQLWLHVNFGLEPTAMETIAYVTDAKLPFDDNKKISAIH